MSEHEAINFDEELLKELASAPEFKMSDNNLITVGKVWISDLGAKRFNGKGIHLSNVNINLVHL